MSKEKLTVIMVFVAILVGLLAPTLLLYSLTNMEYRIMFLDEQLWDKHPEVMQEYVNDTYPFSSYFKDLIIDIGLFRYCGWLLLGVMIIVVLRLMFTHKKKAFLIEFAIAFLFGIAGFLAMSILGYMEIIGIYLVPSFAGDKSIFFVCIFVGIPIGSSLGVFVAKKFLLKTGKFSILCLATSLIFAFLASRYVWLAIPYLSDIIVFPLVALFALIGYNVIGLFKKTKVLPE